MWGMRVVIPKKLQGQVLQELHRDYPGFTNEKLCKKPFLVAGLDKEIEKLSSRVWHARVYAMHLLQLLSTCVYVPQDHGNASMWTLQDPSWGSHS